MKFRVKAADLIFIILSLALIAGSLLFIARHGNGTPRAIIKVRDTEYIYPLNMPQTLTFHGELGPATVIIRDNAVFFQESPCRDKICIHMGEGRKDGDFMACLPNRIIITVENSR
ncbi:MAG: NusG domain II-containing protein [Spirochaetia bacterium]|nr:NusG domain II-containing protein [Spirochaetia bacterium]